MVDREWSRQGEESNRKVQNNESTLLVAARTLYIASVFQQAWNWQTITSHTPACVQGKITLECFCRQSVLRAAPARLGARVQLQAVICKCVAERAQLASLWRFNRSNFSCIPSVICLFFYYYYLIFQQINWFNHSVQTADFLFNFRLEIKSSSRAQYVSALCVPGRMFIYMAYATASNIHLLTH